MKRNLLPLIFSLLPAFLFGQLATWPGINNITPNPVTIKGTGSTGFDAGTLRRGSGVKQNGAPVDGYRSNRWPLAGTTLADAIAGDDYVQVTITAESAEIAEFTWDLIQISVRRNADGPQECSCLTSTDGFATFTTQGTINPTTASPGTVENFFVTGFDAFPVPNDVDLTIRLYCYDATSDNGMLEITDDFGDGTTDGIRISGSIVLPIELASFNAEVLGNTVALEWTTASEVDNDFMAVEHSQNGVEFNEIGRLQGAGTTVVPQNYTFIDESPSPGINYYRLRQVDFDGKMEYHDVIAVNIGNTGVLQVFPTVTSSSLNISITGGANLQVLNTSGQILVQKNIVDSEILNVEDLAPGIYFLRVDSGNTFETVRFLKR